MSAKLVGAILGALGGLALLLWGDAESIASLRRADIIESIAFVAGYCLTGAAIGLGLGTAFEAARGD